MLALEPDPPLSPFPVSLPCYVTLPASTIILSGNTSVYRNPAKGTHVVSAVNPQWLPWILSVRFGSAVLWVTRLY